MNIYLLQLVGKWISLSFISLASLFTGFGYNEDFITTKNADVNKGINIVSKVVEYKTIINYKKNLPQDVEKVITDGIDGLVYVNGDGIEEVIKEMQPKVIEVGTGPNANYVGKITGYGPDCPGCSKVGNVACRTREGKNHSLIYDSIYYKDVEFGDVRVLAAARDVFPCGTVISVSKGDVKFTGIVMDTGGAMISAWKNSGTILLDLAYPSQQDALKKQIIHGTNVKYEVQRWGW